MKLSKNFNRNEFACKCGCGFSTVDTKLIDMLEIIRQHFDKPVRIRSGCRCATHNAVVGGAAKSQHLVGRAADIAVKDVTPNEVHDFIVGWVGPYWGGIGKYNTFTHVDSREEPARWGK